MKRMLQREFRKLRRISVHPTFLFLTLAGNSLLVVSTLLIHRLEKGVNPHMERYFDCLWWGVSTITTVGFGDVVPVTHAGRIVGMLLMYTGTVLFVCFIGVLGSIWTSAELEREIQPLEEEIRVEGKETERLERLILDIHRRLDRMEKP